MHEPPDPLSATPITLPVIEERLTVGRRTEEIGALRVRLELERHDAGVRLERAADAVSVERVPVDRLVDERREPWQEGDTLVVPVYAEVEVVQRRLLLVEELRLVRRRVHEAIDTTVPLARQRAVVERRDADGRWVEADVATARDETAPPSASDDPSLPSGDPR